MSHLMVQAKQIECATRNAGANGRFDPDTYVSDWSDYLFRHFLFQQTVKFSALCVPPLEGNADS